MITNELNYKFYITLYLIARLSFAPKRLVLSDLGFKKKKVPDIPRADFPDPADNTRQECCCHWFAPLTLPVWAIWAGDVPSDPPDACM